MTTINYDLSGVGQFAHTTHQCWSYVHCKNMLEIAGDNIANDKIKINEVHLSFY